MVRCFVCKIRKGKGRWCDKLNCLIILLVWLRLKNWFFFAKMSTLLQKECASGSIQRVSLRPTRNGDISLCGSRSQYGKTASK